MPTETPHRDVLRIAVWDAVLADNPGEADTFKAGAIDLLELHWGRGGLTRGVIYSNVYSDSYHMLCDLMRADHHANVCWSDDDVDRFVDAVHDEHGADAQAGGWSRLDQLVRRLNLPLSEELDGLVGTTRCVELEWLREAMELAKPGSMPPLRRDGEDLAWEDVPNGDPIDVELYRALRWRLRLVAEVLHVGLNGALYTNRMRLPVAGRAQFDNPAGHGKLFEFRIQTSTWRTTLNQIPERTQ